MDDWIYLWVKEYKHMHIIQPFNPFGSPKKQKTWQEKLWESQEEAELFARMKADEARILSERQSFQTINDAPVLQAETLSTTGAAPGGAAGAVIDTTTTTTTTTTTSAPFNPANLPGAKVIIDASEETGLTDGNAYIPTEFAQSLTFIEADENNRPVWEETGINGNPCWFFDDTNDKLYADNPGLNAASSFTLVLAAEATHDATVGANSALPFIWIGSVGTNAWRCGSSGVILANDWVSHGLAINTNFLEAGTTSTDFEFTTGTPYVYVLTLETNSNVLRLNGTQVTLNTFWNATATTNLTPGRFSPPDKININSNFAGSGGVFGARINFLGMYTPALSTENLDALESYVGDRIGATIIH